MYTRESQEQNEKQLLAPYAMKSKDTEGRKFKEEEPLYRTVYQRDKDRIVHSSAFRRLEYKTQVFVNHEGDYYRTRLTHSLEVAQIARTISRALGLNQDLAEVIALAHDIGHTPFGHAGEDILDEIMRMHGDKKGFEHNRQGLRVCDFLEEKYADFSGLNLSYEVREGFMKHRTGYDKPIIDTNEFKLEEAALLEAQVVNISDEIAYDTHDLDDGLTSGIFTSDDLKKDVSLWQQSVRMIINKQVIDLIKTSLDNIKERNINSIEDVRKNGKNVISFSSQMIEKRSELKRFLYEKMYRHYRVVRMCTKAKRFISELFFEYQKNPEQLPQEHQDKIEKWGLERVICDYIAGMTDRYALSEYQKLFDPFVSV